MIWGNKIQWNPQNIICNRRTTLCGKIELPHSSIRLSLFFKDVIFTMLNFFLLMQWTQEEMHCEDAAPINLGRLILSKRVIYQEKLWRRRWLGILECFEVPKIVRIWKKRGRKRVLVPGSHGDKRSGKGSGQTFPIWSWRSVRSR